MKIKRDGLDKERKNYADFILFCFTECTDF